MENARRKLCLVFSLNLCARWTQILKHIAMPTLTVQTQIGPNILFRKSYLIFFSSAVESVTVKTQNWLEMEKENFTECDLYLGQPVTLILCILVHSRANRARRNNFYHACRSDFRNRIFIFISLYFRFPYLHAYVFVSDGVMAFFVFLCLFLTIMFLRYFCFPFLSSYSYLLLV